MRVSVVMATYNAMPYLPDAAGSILDQTLRQFELIIVNDGSTDGTRDYLRSLDDDRVRVLEQTNQGQQAAANAGIAAAQTNLIARMDADDVSEPDRLEKQVSFLDANPSVGLVGSQIYRLGDAKRGLPSRLPCDHKGIDRALLANHHAICNPTIVFRKELFEQIGGYWQYDIAEDWDMFLRIGEISLLANLPEALLSYRFHADSINGRRMVEAQLYNEFACELARRRRRGDQPITIERFRHQHRSSRWPQSWLFHLDCQSVAQYRVAVAEVLNGRPIQGYGRLAYSMACSPSRTLQRMQRLFVR
ncbi:MAG: glycosyltransferase family A protein [Planctomycetota bacterium]